MNSNATTAPSWRRSPRLASSSAGTKVGLDFTSTRHGTAGTGSTTRVRRAGEYPDGPAGSHAADRGLLRTVDRDRPDPHGSLGGRQVREARCQPGEEDLHVAAPEPGDVVARVRRTLAHPTVDGDAALRLAQPHGLAVEAIEIHAADGRHFRRGDGDAAYERPRIRPRGRGELVFRRGCRGSVSPSGPARERCCRCPMKYSIDRFQNSSCQIGFGSLIPWPTRAVRSPPVRLSTQLGGEAGRRSAGRRRRARRSRRRSRSSGSRSSANAAIAAPTAATRGAPSAPFGGRRGRRPTRAPPGRAPSRSCRQATSGFGWRTPRSPSPCAS